MRKTKDLKSRVLSQIMIHEGDRFKLFKLIDNARSINEHVKNKELVSIIDEKIAMLEIIYKGIK